MLGPEVEELVDGDLLACQFFETLPRALLGALQACWLVGGLILWLRRLIGPPCDERAGRQQLGQPSQFPDLAFAPVASRYAPSTRPGMFGNAA